MTYIEVRSLWETRCAARLLFSQIIAKPALRYLSIRVIQLEIDPEVLFAKPDMVGSPQFDRFIKSPVSCVKC